MLATNVAIVFGPTLMRAETDSLEMATLMPVQNGIVEIMVNEFETIFRKWTHPCSFHPSFSLLPLSFIIYATTWLVDTVYRTYFSAWSSSHLRKIRKIMGTPGISIMSLLSSFDCCWHFIAVFWVPCDSIHSCNTFCLHLHVIVIIFRLPYNFCAWLALQSSFWYLSKIFMACD